MKWFLSFLALVLLALIPAQAKKRIALTFDDIPRQRGAWLTPDEREQFELTTFTPHTLRKLFERSGFEVLDVVGKPVIPVRQNKKLLEHPEAINRLLKLEQDLMKDATTAARSAHLQITARRR